MKYLFGARLAILESALAGLAGDVIRPTPAERNANPRSSTAKLRWARRGKLKIKNYKWPNSAVVAGGSFSFCNFNF